MRTDGPRPTTVTPVPTRALDALRFWGPRQWAVAAGGALATALLIGLPTDVIPNPVFGRPVEVTWWSPWVLALTAVLGGLLLATYVRESVPAPEGGGNGAGDPGLDRPGRQAGVGGLLAFFAVGCPVCNKLVVVALGATGALELFAPVQPLLAIGSVVLLAVALRARLRGSVACAIPERAGPTS